MANKHRKFMQPPWSNLEASIKLAQAPRDFVITCKFNGSGIQQLCKGHFLNRTLSALGRTTPTDWPQTVDMLLPYFGNSLLAYALSPRHEGNRNACVVCHKERMRKFWRERGR